jgi:GTP-binding protein
MVIRSELEQYSADLALYPEIVLLNKADLVDVTELAAELFEHLRAQALKRAGGDEYSADYVEPMLFAVSAVTGLGMDGMMRACAQKVIDLRQKAAAERPVTPQYDQVWELRRSERDRAFKVQNLGGKVFRVEGKAVERMVIQTEWENEEAVAYLQRRLERFGVEKALVAAGAGNGDEIRILGRAFALETHLIDDEELAE